MALVKCPECQESVSDTASMCPHCGYAVADHFASQPEAPAFQQEPEERPATNKEPSAGETFFGCLTMTAFIVFCCIPGSCGLKSQCDKEEAEEAQQKQRAAEIQKKKEERRVELEVLKSNFPDEESKLRKLLEEARTALDGDDLPASKAKLDELEQALIPYRPMKAPPQGLLQLRQDAQATEGIYKAKSALVLMKDKQWEDALSAFEEAEKLGASLESWQKEANEVRLEVAQSRRTEADKLKKEKSWIAAESSYQSALQVLTAVPKDKRSKAQKSEIKRIESKLKSAKKKADKIREEEAAKQLYIAACGDAPQLDPWDNGISSVERYVESTAHDPDSIDIEACGSPVMTSDNCWKVSCHVLGKNAFGAKVRNVGTFWIASGRVVKAKM